MYASAFDQVSHGNVSGIYDDRLSLQENFSSSSIRHTTLLTHSTAFLSQIISSRNV